MGSSAIALMFPGQGSQKVGMGRELYERFPAAREVFDEAGEALGYDLKRLCFEGPEEELRLTVNTQPALLSHSYAGFRLLEENGLVPRVALGHSLGEYSALVAAGALAFSDALRLVQKRSTYMQEVIPPGKGGMAAILGLDRDKVDHLCRQDGNGVVAANYNSATQVVISGVLEGVERVANACKRAGAKRALFLPVSAPFHSPLLQEAENRLARDLDANEFNRLRFPVIDNASASLNDTAEKAKNALKRQVTSPVLWEESIRRATEAGVDTFIEIGPGKVLSGLAARIVPDVRVLQVEDSESLERTLETLETLA